MPTKRVSSYSHRMFNGGGITTPYTDVYLECGHAVVLGGEVQPKDMPIELDCIECESDAVLGVTEKYTEVLGFRRVGQQHDGATQLYLRCGYIKELPGHMTQETVPHFVRCDECVKENCPLEKFGKRKAAQPDRPIFGRSALEYAMGAQDAASGIHDAGVSRHYRDGFSDAEGEW